MAEEVVLYEVSERIATVTLNRPEKRNALNSDVLRLLPQLLARADKDDAVDVVILTGADPAFSAGLDLKQLGDTGDNLRGTGADGAPNASGVRGPFPTMTKPLVDPLVGQSGGATFMSEDEFHLLYQDLVQEVTEQTFH